MGASEKEWALLAVLLMLGGLMAASGCLGDDEDENGDDELKIPDDRKGEKLWIIGETDIEITIEEMVEMGLVDFEATFINSVGTTYTSNYTGILLQDLLDLVEPVKDGDLLWITAGDGYRVTMYLGDVDDSTYVALMEEDEWNDLDDDGVFRLVDTDLPSVYWVRDMETVQVAMSNDLWTGGYTDEKWLVDVGWIKEHSSMEVSWQEGEKTRTYTGVPMSEVLTAVGADTGTATTLSIGDDDDIEMYDIGTALTDGVLLVDSRGDYVYYPGPGESVQKGIWRIFVGTTVTLGGEVYSNITMDLIFFADNADIDVPWVNLTYYGSEYVGTPLEWIIDLASYSVSEGVVKVSAIDGYYAVFPITNLSTTFLAFMDDEGNNLTEDDGLFRIIDTSRPGPFQVSMVSSIEVLSGTPLEASGAVEVTDAITLITIDIDQDTVVTYNDGRKDRTYAALSWDKVLEVLSANTSATHVNITDSEDNVVTCDLSELTGRMDGGICADPRGRYVAVFEELGDHVYDVVGIEVG